MASQRLSQDNKPPRVAIFSQDNFPRYGVGWSGTPRQIMLDLKQAGIEADLLDIEALADPKRFHIEAYHTLILLYGNTYPEKIMPNLQAFRRAGGSLVATGIPFTHPVVKKTDGSFSDLGHRDTPARWGKDGVGIGGFAGPASGAPAPQQIVPDDPLKLQGVIRSPQTPLVAPQWLDAKSLPKGVTLIPAFGEANRPTIALLIQNNGPFKGAVDAWTYKSEAGEWESYETRQIIGRATVAVLSRRGALDSGQTKQAFAAFDAMLRPKVYENITLPVVKKAYSTFQPKMSRPSKHLLVANIKNMSADEKILLTSLQGLVNKAEPRLYFLTDDNDDLFWLEELKRQGEIENYTMLDDPWSLLQRFRSSYHGAVLCDPNIYVSPCVAASLCGADEILLLRTPELAAKHNIKVTTDLRGKFKDGGEALRYLRTQVAPRLDPYLTCSLDPAVFHNGALDHLIASRASIFWITGPMGQTLPGANQTAEWEEVRAFFASLPLGAIVRGFWWNGDGKGLQEEDGVALGSRFGKPTLVSDLITNLSVHSGVPATKLTQKPRPAPPKFDPTKVYLAFTMSDGDNLCTWRGYFRRYFNDPARGTFPLGWGMGPGLIDLAPAWARWYYENATTNDEFFCDVSGAAYIYPPSWGASLTPKARKDAFKWFYSQTQSSMDRMDMKTIRLMNVQTKDIQEVGEFLPKTKFIMADYGHAGPEKYQELTYTLPTNQTIFRAATNGSGPENLANQIRRRAGKNRPAFLNAFIWNWGSALSDLKKTLEILGPDFIAVTPSQLDSLYREANHKK
jgi:diadenosine tetraphosphatase ApaH/serine/threonine PP2A family protein phosphatase